MNSLKFGMGSLVQGKSLCIRFNEFGLTIFLDSETIIRKLAILNIPYFMGDVRRAYEDKNIF